jgi:DNA-binding transcriptional MerR regulator
MLRIGDFSKIGQVSVKTLRYYDAVDLLNPIDVDPATGYRYYSFDMLPKLNRILALKELGLSLEQIKQLLEDDLSAEQLRGMLRLKQVEIHQQMADEKEKQQLLPGVDTMATVVHKGPFLTIGEAYSAIIKWIEANGYGIHGPAREVYLRPAVGGSQTDPETVTEIQFPVKIV